MRKRALITGINGFVGTYLKNYLIQCNWDVIGLGIVQEEGVIPCDITDRKQILDVFENSGEISHVFHLAAQTFVPTANDAPLDTMNINYGGTVNLLQTLKMVSPETRFIYISSADIYGPPLYLPVDEKHPLNPPNAYAISKAAADQYCSFFYKATNMHVVSMRPFNHSGPGQSDQFVLSNFAKQIAVIEAGLKPPVIQVGNLDAARDFLHVQDVVRAYMLAAEQADSGTVFNVCSGRSNRIQDALNFMIEHAKLPVTVEKDPDRMRPTDVKDVRGNAEMLTQATGWLPEHSFDMLLQDLLTYWRNNIGVSK